MDYLLHLLILTSFYVILAQSLSLTAGYAGMVSLTHAGFYGIGGYTTAILSINYNLSILVTLPCGILFCGIIALIFSTITLRTIDDYFIICTLGVQIIIFSIMNNWMGLTKGPLGISNISPISIFGFNLNDNIFFLCFCLFLALLIYIFLTFITKSNFGRVLKALSEDEIYTKSIGKNVYLHKVIAFTISAMIAAIPGVLYAHYISFIDPTSFTVDESIFILSIVIIGGIRNFKGIIFASIFLVALPEGLRLLGMPNSIAANLRQIIYSIIMIFVIFKSKKDFCFSIRKIIL